MSTARTNPAPTARQADVLRFVRSHIRTHGMAPTRAEIGGLLGISRPTAEQHLQALAAKGHLVLRKQWRGIYLAASALRTQPQRKGARS